MTRSHFRGRMGRQVGKCPSEKTSRNSTHWTPSRRVYSPRSQKTPRKNLRRRTPSRYPPRAAATATAATATAAPAAQTPRPARSNAPSSITIFSKPLRRSTARKRGTPRRNPRMSPSLRAPNSSTTTIWRRAPPSRRSASTNSATRSPKIHDAANRDPRVSKYWGMPFRRMRPCLLGSVPRNSTRPCCPPARTTVPRGRPTSRAMLLRGTTPATARPTSRRSRTPLPRALVPADHVRNAVERHRRCLGRSRHRPA